MSPLFLSLWNLYLSSNVHNIIDDYYLNPNTLYNLVPLSNTHSEYVSVENLFMETALKHYIIHKIERLDNPFLYGCYQLKKEELKIR